MTDDVTPGGIFPIDDRRLEQAFYLGVLVWVGSLMGLALQWSYKDQLVPFIVGIPTIALVLMQLLPVDWSGLLERFVTVSLEPDGPEPGVEGLLDGGEDDVGFDLAKRQRVATELIGWCVALVGLVYLFGYYFVLPPYVFAFFWYFYRDVRKAAVYALGFTVAVTLLFVVLFDVTLYSGALGLPNPTYFL